MNNDDDGGLRNFSNDNNYDEGVEKEYIKLKHETRIRNEITITVTVGVCVFVSINMK